MTVLANPEKGDSFYYVCGLESAESATYYVDAPVAVKSLRSTAELRGSMRTFSAGGPHESHLGSVDSVL